MKLRSILAAGALAVTAAASLATAATAKEWKAVTIATEGAYAPWNLTNPDGTLGGFEIDLVKNLCDRMKIECKIVTQDWDGMIPALKAGKFDVMMDAVSITPEREAVIAFTAPYAATPASFATAKDGLGALPGTGTTIKLTGSEDKSVPAIAALREALKGKTIGIQTATIYTKFVYDNFKDIATIREYKTAPEHDLDLAAGRIDAAFDDDTYFSAAFEKPENSNLAISGPEITGAVWGKGEGFGIRKEDTELKALFDTAIAAAIADGTVKTLSMKWFKVDITP